ncbi:MAG: hypothetical protein JXR13_18780 [Thalassovita sp.]
MINIDFSQMITAEDKAAQQQADLMAARKAECRARIFAVVDQTAQMNLAAAAAAGALNDAEMDMYRIGLGWIDQTRAACQTGDWPDVPEGVAELADAF